MDTVIKQISEIESAAAAVMDAANGRKKAFAEEMAESMALSLCTFVSICRRLQISFIRLFWSSVS